MVAKLYQIDSLPDVLVAEKEIELYDLVVFNDDVNTFEHVINTLIQVCKHSSEQAEQCTWIIHYKGKCSVKKGSFEELAPMRQGICDKGISAEIL
ncbi:ATP-dependent Clp protease adaptor ClpS [Cytophagales bacterium LB-30]|uniref:ATP-dependent Clp protease adaptor ClpS n=1 Tax=Shiella aurantiaca TaxID=3058365 RepID=A0ABT8F7L9_9BACT|nr:ATP-dependent Clp protease adaptor ClpS [Shiella aurantiaca]MDN4166385.1 ATP-dependent Clp protease adaptor ClpS [Shiella aurantiaca]